MTSPTPQILAPGYLTDDTSLVAAANNLHDLQRIMNAEVEKVQVWLLANKLSVHYVKKSQYMLINNNMNRIINNNDFELKMGGHRRRRKTKNDRGLLHQGLEYEGPK